MAKAMILCELGITQVLISALNMQTVLVIYGLIVYRNMYK